MQRPSNKAVNILLATGGLGVLLAGLAIVDKRVRDQFAHIVTGQGPSGEVGNAVEHVHRVTAGALHVLHDQSLLYTPLTIFGIVAIALFFFMKRT